MTNEIVTYEKEVRYDREGHEYVAYMNGSLVGYFNTKTAAEIALSKMAIEYLKRH